MVQISMLATDTARIMPRFTRLQRTVIAELCHICYTEEQTRKATSGLKPSELGCLACFAELGRSFSPFKLSRSVEDLVVLQELDLDVAGMLYDCNDCHAIIYGDWSWPKSSSTAFRQLLMSVGFCFTMTNPDHCQILSCLF